MTQQSKLVLIGALGVVVAAFFVSRLLMEFDWNPTTTIKFGYELPKQVAYGQRLLGDVVVAADAGHDGKFFFSQAMDPFYLDPEVHAIHLDRPTYRAQRMLYPTIAGLGGLLSPTATAWGLIVVNVLAMGVGTAITARLAIEMGISPWFGLAFLFNPGLIVSLNIDGADIIAVAALMAAVLFAMQERPLGAAVALSISALSRETMIIGAVGLIAYWFWKRRTVPRVMSMPFIAVAVWWLYVHWRLDDVVIQDTQAIGPPFQGFIEAFRGWLMTPGSLNDALIGCAILFASLVIVTTAFRRPSALSWAVAGFSLLAVILSEPVWAEYFDLARALAPVLTTYVLLAVSSARSTSRGDRDDAPQVVVSDAT
jgi:hypothetical protein